MHEFVLGVLWGLVAAFAIVYTFAYILLKAHFFLDKAYSMWYY